MKYIHKQKHRSTCAAVAIANAFRKLGKHVTYGQAIGMFGGLKAFEKTKKNPYGGVSNNKVARIAKKHGLYVLSYHLTYEECVLLSSLKDVAIAVCYSGRTSTGVFGHIVTLNRKGRALNAGKRGLTERHWESTRQVWGFNPVVFIFSRKKLR